MAQELSGYAPAVKPARRKRSRFWMAMLALGGVAVLVGVGLILGPIIAVMLRGNADHSQLQNWNQQNLRGAAPGNAANAGHTVCGSSSPSDYALVKFDQPADDHYAGVAGDGTWDLLNSRSMVHYTGTPDPGQRGNSIIAFHREPDYQNIDQMKVADTITIQDRSCKTFTYKITGRWDIPPEKVTQLAPTSGYDLTLVTCDPWWQDYNRLVWRAQLVNPPSGSSGNGGSSSAAPSNPSF
ncbi:MAG: sortase [Candidatus Dormibacteria bacterium]